MTKTTILLALGLLLLGLPATTPAAAKSISMKIVSEAALHAACDKVGGDFIGGGGAYTCDSRCGTGHCVIECDEAKKSCVGTVPNQARIATYTPRDVLAAPVEQQTQLEFSGTDGFGSRHSGESAPAGGGGYVIGQWHASHDNGGLGGIFATH